MIARLNKNFICTSMIIDDVNKLAQAGDELAKALSAEWQYPVEMMFLSPECKLISKLNSFEDFPGEHPDVVAANRRAHAPLVDERSHVDIFLSHLSKHFAQQ